MLNSVRASAGPLYGIALTVLIALLSVPLFLSDLGVGPPVRSGWADFRGAGLHKPVALAGSWRFEWAGRPGVAAMMPVPGQWAGARLADGTTLPPRGEAAYALQLRGLPAGHYRLYVPIFNGASRVEVDGRELSRYGAFAGDGQYGLRAHDVRFSTPGERDVAVRIALANPFRSSGLETAPVVGGERAMAAWAARRWAQEAIIQIVLALLALFGFVIYLFRPQDRASLYLALACVGFSIPALNVGYDNLLLLFAPATSPELILASTWCSGLLGVVALLANVQTLFPLDGRRGAYRALVSTGVAAAVAVAAAFLVFGPYAGSSVAAAVPAVVLLAMLYITVVVVRAALRGRSEAYPLVVGIGVASVAILMVAAIAAGELVPTALRGFNYAGFGALTLLIAQLIVLAQRWNSAIVTTERLNDDLRQLLEVNSAITSDLQLNTLLEKIVAVTTKIVRADRTSLFLKDKDDATLSSLVAQGVTDDRIRFDVGRGLAGYVFATGDTVNIPDAYADERFNRTVDEDTGYRTRSVLAVPIATRDGRRLGVMQSLNRDDGAAFTSDDATRLTAFGAQAAIAIDNARLFSEALAAKNFDESILRSMAGGVVALDREWKITKLNAAAAEILGASTTLLGGLDARALLHGQNPWLLPELEAVAASGEVKLLMDVELATARPKPASVNLSITPLRGEHGPSGLLLVIEDISEEKRLQGAMRRFMTQEVVDQVLARDDEPLFGTACQASVMFADVRGFTTMAEALSARETVETLNELFTDLYEAVSDNRGVLDKYIGDAVMAVFGAPVSSGRDAANALAAGIEMLNRLDAVNARRRERDASPLRIGIGIATGEVVAGTIGSPKRMDYTVIGDSVNLASRLQDLSKVYGVELLVCEATAAAAAESNLALRELDVIRVRGRTRPAKIFEVFSRPAAAEAREPLLAAYAEGRARMAGRDWAGAAAAFERALAFDPADGPSALLFERARSLAAAPPPGEWDGVWQGPAKQVVAG